MPSFSGAALDPIRDTERLKRQIDCLRKYALDGRWRSVQTLTSELRVAYPHVGFPENSVSAQLRNLRKEHFRVERRHVRNGLHEYRLLPPLPPVNGELFSDLDKNALPGTERGTGQAGSTTC